MNCVARKIFTIDISAVSRITPTISKSIIIFQQTLARARQKMSLYEKLISESLIVPPLKRFQ